MKHHLKQMLDVLDDAYDKVTIDDVTFDSE